MNLGCKSGEMSPILISSLLYKIKNKLEEDLRDVTYFESLFIDIKVSLSL